MLPHCDCLAGGLMATALVNIAFGFGNAYIYFCVIWATNGILQVGGFVFPSQQKSGLAGSLRHTGTAALWLAPVCIIADEHELMLGFSDQPLPNTVGVRQTCGAFWHDCTLQGCTQSPCA